MLEGESAGDGDALAHAAGQLRRMAVLESGEPDQGDEAARTLVPLGLADTGDFEREAHILDHSAPGKVDSSWNTMPIDLCGPRRRSPSSETLPR